ncbi:hypothetical protein EVAR_57881_1 [Eumeta japonica]|uniref:Uncharacterized protein n=1 Tax=Eumeta variegata TaxID=151549 RepID=A0A4C1ZC68_EUMVA|nr:hypothetical protein EVAR_57881_1 [Eumeta japonica]
MHVAGKRLPRNVMIDPPDDLTVEGLMMEPEGKHRNSTMKQRILAVFGLVEIVLRCTLTMNDFQGLMMQLEGKHSYSIIGQHIQAVFAVVGIVLECTLTVIGFQGLMMEPEGSDNGAGSLEAPSSDPESQSWSKSISGPLQQAQIWEEISVSSYENENDSEVKDFLETQEEAQNIEKEDDEEVILIDKAGLMMKVESSHRKTVTKRHNPFEFEFTRCYGDIVNRRLSPQLGSLSLSLRSTVFLCCGQK